MTENYAVKLTATTEAVRTALRDAEKLLYSDDASTKNALRLLKFVWRLAEQAGVEIDESK